MISEIAEDRGRTHSVDIEDVRRKKGRRGPKGPLMSPLSLTNSCQGSRS
jgi:hypothetical protein